MKRGTLLTIDGELYAVTHTKADGRRGAIDLISITEARRRYEDLDNLLREAGLRND